MMMMTTMIATEVAFVCGGRGQGHGSDFWRAHVAHPLYRWFWCVASSPCDEFFFFFFFFRLKYDFLKEDKRTAAGQATFPADKSNEAKNGSDDTRDQ